ncbi:MAG: glycosyltransferase family 4 protein [Patescibacteria group bacterium]
MKTLLVTMDFPPLLGGISQYYHNRVKKISLQEIVVLMNKIKGYEGVKLDSKIYFKKFFIKYFWPHWILLFWHVWKIIKKEKIDRIWVGQVLPVGTAVWVVCKILNLFNKNKNINYFVTCHGNDLLRAKSNFRKFKLARKILHKAEFVEANTEFTKNILIKDYNINNSKIKIVYPECTLSKDMVDNDKVKELKEKYGLENKKVLLTVGRLVESKGIDQVIKSLDIVKREIPDLIYMVIGDGPDKDRLKQLSDNVVFIGPVPFEQLPNYYSVSHSFIMTPRKNMQGDTESFGVVYLEAQAFGLPVIAGDTGGAREASDNFMFVDSEDINQIANSIINSLKV